MYVLRRHAQSMDSGSKTKMGGDLPSSAVDRGPTDVDCIELAKQLPCWLYIYRFLLVVASVLNQFATTDNPIGTCKSF